MITIRGLGNKHIRAYQVSQVSHLPQVIKDVIHKCRYGEDDNIPPSQLLLRILIQLFKKYDIVYKLVNIDVSITKQSYDYVLPNEYLSRLLQHQLDLLPIVIHRERFMIADDVGMGKTITTISAINAVALRDDSVCRLLVVTLKNLIPQWISELDKWLLPKVKENLGITITNYDQLRLAKNDWLYREYADQIVVFDEAHLIKNRQAERSKASNVIAQSAKYVWLLTGSPLEKSPADLWHLLHLLDSKIFSSYWNFRECFVQEEVNPYTGYSKIIGAKNFPILHDLVTPYYKRRTRELLDLKEPQVIPIHLDMSEEHSKEYTHLEKAVWDEIKDKPILNAISRITQLRQAAIHPERTKVSLQAQGKMTLLCDLVESFGMHKFVLFSSFKWSAELAAKMLQSKFNVIHYEAGDPSSKLDTFKDDCTVQGLCSTVQALGVGHNLQTANIVIFLDIPLSRTQYVQAIGRVARIGQKQQPIVYHVLMRNTIDMLIAYRLAQKEQTFNESLICSDFVESRKNE